MPDPTEQDAPPTAQKQQIASPEMVGSWVRALGAPPLLVVIPDGGTRDLIESAARDQDYEVLWANRGVGAYKLALEHRPLAIISDQTLPDCGGRDLLAALRRDYFVREIPFIMIPAAEVAAKGDTAVASVMQGLAAVLTPGCALHERLQHTTADVNGWAEPVGLGRLLRTIDALELDGSLRLERPERQASAKLTFRGGELCGVTVETSNTSFDLLGFTDLLGFEWRAYSISRKEGGTGQPLGDFPTLLEQARSDNNALLERVYHEGTRAVGIHVDEPALDNYLQTVPPSCLEPLIRIVDGDAPITMAEPETEAMLRSLLYEMRRQGALRLESLEALVDQDGRQWSVLTARAPRQTGVPPGTDKEAAVRQRKARKRRRGNRLLVVVLTFLITLGLAGGGLYVAHRFLGDGHPVGRLWSMLLDRVGLVIR